MKTLKQHKVEFVHVSMVSPRVAHWTSYTMVLKAILKSIISWQKYFKVLIWIFHPYLKCHTDMFMNLSL